MLRHKYKLQGLTVSLAITGTFTLTALAQSRATQTRLQEQSTPISPVGVSRLYGATALGQEGQVSYDKGPRWMKWTGPGTVAWKVSVAGEGDYEIGICYSSKGEGSQFEIASSGSKLKGTLRQANGVFEDSSLNFEKIPVGGKLRLSAGDNNITFSITQAVRDTVLYLRSLELTPVAVKRKIAAEEEKARKRRASTDWFATSGYGVMFHWTDLSQPREGSKKSYPEAVRDFDVRAFAEMVQETGAAYVLFTVNHANPHCPAPIRSWEKVQPGWTTQRDLIGEIADQLNQRGIKLMLYFASHIFGKMGKATAEEYFDIHERVLTEIGLRYSKKVTGYWLDAWYQSLEQYPNISFERLFKALKAGNPDRIVAYNFWIYPVETKWQEYWAGEIGAPQKPAASQYLGDGAGKGLQYHTLLMLDAPWVHDKPHAEMESPRFADQQLISYVKACMANKGVVTLNLGIFQDGTIGKETLRQMQSLRKAIRSKANGQ